MGSGRCRNDDAEWIALFDSWFQGVSRLFEVALKLGQLATQSIKLGRLILT